MIFRSLSALVAFIFLMAACATTGTAPSPEPPAALAPTQDSPGVVEPGSSFELTSTAFAQGGLIPQKYSCDGGDVSPPLSWSDPPAGTQSLALIVHDPDAPGGTWDHWILFNIPPDTRSFQEDLPVTGKNVDPDAIFVGNNSWGRPDYGGPCPPSGTHRYFFKLYALDTTINLLPGATKGELLSAMERHILAEAELMGTYRR